MFWVHFGYRKVMAVLISYVKCKEVILSLLRKKVHVITATFIVL